MSDEHNDEAGFDPADDVPEAPVDGGDADGVAPAAPTVSVTVPTTEPKAEPTTPTAEPEPGVVEEVIEYVYVDEHGNEVSAPDDAPPPAATAMSGKGKAIVAGVGVAVIAVVGVVAVGLHGIGSQNTVGDIKAGAQSRYAAASSSVVAKSSEVRGEVVDTAVDTCNGGLAAAMAAGSTAPKLELDVVSSVPLPGPFISATAPNADGQQGKVSLLQLSKTGWGVYTTVPLTRAERKAEISRPGFHKADVVVDDSSIRVTGDRPWPGGDVGGAGSCDPGRPGVYAATGAIPADAMGLVDGQASVTAIQGVAGEPTKAVAVMGNSVALVRLVEAEPEGGGEASSSSSPVPSR